MRRTPPKSRVRVEKPQVVVKQQPQQPATERRDDTPPGYSGHNGGSFSDAGYRSGRGLFGFQQRTY